LYVINGAGSTAQFHQRGCKDDGDEDKQNDEDELVEQGLWVDDEFHDVTRWPDVRKLNRWQPQGVDWLWEPYVPAAAVSLLSGATGVGKTYLALAIAASVTSRQPAAAGGVLYMTVGNDPGQFLRPRFDKLGGDPERLHVVRGFNTDFVDADYSEIQLCEVADTLPSLIEKEKLRLIVIDPFETYLGSGRGPDEARTMELVELISRMAENTRCGVLLVGGARPPKALAAAVRSELVAGIVTSPAACSKQAEYERALVQVKSNLGPAGRPLRYVIAAGDQFSWSGESAISDAGLLLPEDDPEKRVALREAIEFLRHTLAAGPVPAVKVKQAAKDRDISERTLRRAKHQLGVISDKDGQAKWDWHLPDLPASAHRELDSENTGGMDGRLGNVGPLHDSIGLTATA
jgi:hypothetical protein